MPKIAKFSALPTQRTVAKAFGVDVRTIRNWRRNPPKGYFGPLIKAAKDRPDRLLLVARGKKLHQQLIKARWQDQLNASIVLYGICPGNVTDPVKRQLYYNTPAGKFIHPAAAAAIKGGNALHLAVAKLRLAGKEITRKQVAETLGVSVRTLYRLCGRYGVKVSALCPITRHRTPRIDLGKLGVNDLAA